LNYTLTDRPQFKRLTRVCTWVSFGLLILTAASLLISPITQEIWTWDRFLHGGQDFESGILLVLLSLCLVLLLAQHFKRVADLALADWSLKARARNRPAVSRPAPISQFAEDLPPPPARNYRLPLTI
jgi:hypothetical protein